MIQKEDRALVNFIHVPYYENQSIEQYVNKAPTN